MALHKYRCTFPQELISEPIVTHTLGARFGVIPTIRESSITDTAAVVVVEIEGGEAAIQSSVGYLRERGVRVEELGGAGQR